MPITLVNPDGLPKVDDYHHVSVATGSRTVHVAGQVAWDAEGRTVGEGDLAAQVEQCYLNVATALAGVGASFDDVVKRTVYVVDWTLDKLPLYQEGVSRASAKLGVDVSRAPGSLLGIAAPFTPDLMVEVEVEVEAVAVLD
jgi:enamine deaminase RidA (YjgF/YER057c/UK114 family)